MLCSDKTVTSWQQAESDGERGLFLVSGFLLAGGRYTLKFTQGEVTCKNLLEQGLNAKIYSRVGYTLNFTRGGVTL